MRISLLTGQHMLLTAHVTIFKIICAIGALLFSVYNIVIFAWECVPLAFLRCTFVTI